MSRLSSLFVLTMIALSGAIPAHAAGPLLLHNFTLHGFDEQIPATLGYDEAVSVVYFREMGALTADELLLQQQHEQVGCYPFYLMKDGEVVEVGYNCRSFFCVGYEKGPKQCRDMDGQTYGGVVEINRRMNGLQRPPARRYFDELQQSDRTSDMEQRIDDLERIACRPFYFMDFDVAVGEGFDCTELGTYPAFSAARVCTNDWRTKDGMKCTVPLRPDEEEIRMRAIRQRLRDTAVMSGGLLRMKMRNETESGALAGTGAMTETGTLVVADEPVFASFSDVREGSYGYTAIASLAGAGVIHGYNDGTFKPKQTINRAEFMRLALDTLRPRTVRAEAGCFLDVGDRWYAPFVCAAKRLHVVRGYPDGTFRAGQPITKAEALKVLLVLAETPAAEDAELPRGAEADAWYAPYVRSAVAAGVIREAIFPADDLITRADTAVWLYRLQKQDANVAVR